MLGRNLIHQNFIADIVEGTLIGMMILGTSSFPLLLIFNEIGKLEALIPPLTLIVVVIILRSLLRTAQSSPRMPRLNPSTLISLALLSIATIYILTSYIYPLTKVTSISNVRIDIDHKLIIGSFFLLSIFASVAVARELETIGILLAISFSFVFASIIPAIYIFGLGFPHGTDECLLMGIARRIYEGYLPALSTPALAPHQMIFNKFYRISFFSLSILIARLTGLDIYWSQSLLPIIVWNIYVPYISYMASLCITENKKTSILMSLLTFSVESYSYVAGKGISPTLSLVFFYYTAYSAIRFIKYRSPEFKFLCILSTIISFLTDYLVGFYAFIIFSGLVFFRLFLFECNRLVRMRLLLASALSLTLGLLIAGIFIITFYPGERFFNLTTINLSKILFGGYSALNLNTISIFRLVLPLFILLSAIYVVSRLEQISKPVIFTLQSVIVFWFLHIFILNFYGQWGQYYAGRFLIPLGLLGIPLASFAFKDALSLVKRIIIRVRLPSFYKFRLSMACPFLIMLTLVLSGSAVFSFSYTYTFGYPTWPSPVVSKDDLVVAKFIDHLEQEGYVVICDRAFSEVGMTLTGYRTPRGVYTSYWDPQLSDFYKEFMVNPSIDGILRVLNFTGLDTAYVVVNLLRSSTYIGDYFIKINLDRIYDLPLEHLTSPSENVLIFRFKRHSVNNTANPQRP